MMNVTKQNRVFFHIKWIFINTFDLNSLYNIYFPISTNDHGYVIPEQINDSISDFNEV